MMWSWKNLKNRNMEKILRMIDRIEFKQEGREETLDLVEEIYLKSLKNLKRQ